MTYAGCEHCVLRQMSPMPKACEWKILADFIATSPVRWKSLIKKTTKRLLTNRENMTGKSGIYRSLKSVWMRVALFDCSALAIGAENSSVRNVAEDSSRPLLWLFRPSSCMDASTPMRTLVEGRQCEHCLKVYSTHIDLVNRTKRKTALERFLCTEKSSVRLSLVSTVGA